MLDFFVCFFGLFRPIREFFTHLETIAVEGLHILTYARQLWPLSSECSLACHTHRDTGHPRIVYKFVLLCSYFFQVTLNRKLVCCCNLVLYCFILTLYNE